MRFNSPNRSVNWLSNCPKLTPCERPTRYNSLPLSCGAANDRVTGRLFASTDGLESRHSRLDSKF